LGVEKVGLELVDEEEAGKSKVKEDLLRRDERRRKRLTSESFESPTACSKRSRASPWCPIFEARSP